MKLRVATVPRPADVAHETSPWPLALSIALTVLLVGLTIDKRLAMLGALGLVASVAGWTRGVVRHAPAAPQPARTKEWWGVVYLIVTEAMLFAAGFVALFGLAILHDASAPAQFRDLNKPMALVASLVLWSSGATAHLATRARTRRATLAWLAATMLLGVAFVGYQASEYARLAASGFTLASGPHASVFYALTGLHGAHVILGLLALAVLALLVHRDVVTRERAGALHATILYWHFVDAMWIAIYLVLYLKVGP